MTDVAVAVLDGRDLAASLEERLGLPVAATTVDDHRVTIERLAGEASHVIGLAAVPWPRVPALHARASEDVPAYTGVVSWHGLPELAERLAEVVAPGVAAGAHLLVTAPDPGEDTPAEDLSFLREVAEALETRTAPSGRSIAWRGTTRTPTAVTALETLVEAHGRTDVVECPVAPGMGADPALSAAAERLGVRLACADLGRGTQVELLAQVVTTVLAHEGA